MPLDRDMPPARSQAHTRGVRARATALAMVALALGLSMVAATAPRSAQAVNFTAGQNAALVLGAPDFTSPVFSSAATMLNGVVSPTGVAVDASGSVFVGDFSNRIMRWANTPVADGANATNAAQTLDNTLSSWTAACTGGITAPEHISLAGDGAGQKLLVVDRYGDRVVGFTAEPTIDTAKGTLFLGQTNGASCEPNRDPTAPYDPPTATTIMEPTGVWTDGTKIAVADHGNNRVLLWDAWPANGDVGAARVLGQADFVSNLPDRGGVAGQNTLNSPTGVYFDGTYLYVTDADNNRTLVWTGWPAANGANANFVLGQANFGATGAACSAAGQNYPNHVVAFGAGAGHRIAVSTQSSHRVVVYEGFAAAPANGFAATQVLGQPALVNCSANRGLATATAQSLRSPSQLAYDGANLWVADEGNHRVLRFPALTTGTNANRVIGHAGATSTTASSPFDINANAFFAQNTDDNGGQADGGQVAIAPGSGALVATSQVADYAGFWSAAPAVNNAPFTHRLGQNLRTDAGGRGPGDSTTSTTYCNPTGNWTDGTRLLVVDRCNHRVLAWTAMPTSDTDTPDYVIGQVNFTSKISAASQMRLNNPYDVTSDGTDVYVADASNHRVLIYRGFWSAPMDSPPATYVLGQADFTTGTLGISDHELNLPAGIDLDSTGRLAVADNANNRIMVWNHADTIAADDVAADAVLGQADFTSKPTTTRTNFVQDVALAGNAVLWVQAHRAYVQDPIPTSGADLVAASSEIGLGAAYNAVAQNRLARPTGIDAANGTTWIMNTGQGRLMRWDDTTAPTFTAAPTATVRCDGTVTIDWSTSESTSTEIGWDTVTRAWGAYANTSVDATMSGLNHSYSLSFATPGTRYVRVRAVDWVPNAPVVSAEISFTVPPTCPAPTTMLGDDANAQGGAARANPSTTNAPPILGTTFHSSWMNAAGVTMDRREAGTWTTPPEHAGGLWHLDGSTAADVNSQTLNPFTLVNAPPYVGGAFTQALDFNGTTQRATVPDAASIEKTNGFTVDLWFASTNIGNTISPVMMQKSSAAGCITACNFSLEWSQGSNRPTARLTVAGVQQSVLAPIGSATALLDGAWHHMAFTLDAGNVGRLYADGVLIGGPTALPGPADLNNGVLALASSSTAGNYFDGSIDEPRFSPVAYSAAEILGYYRTKRPHAQQLWTSASTALGANCVTATRCEDQVYAGVADILRPGASYWQRTRFNTLTNDYWTDWGNDWLEVNATDSINVTVGSTISFGSQLPGSDAFGTSTVQVTSNSPGGYQLLAHDESDTWALERTPATDTIADRQDGATPPALWTAGTAGFFGITIRDATGGRLPKWGAGTAWPETDVTNNLYTGLENTTDVMLHERTTYSLATDTMLLTSRINAGIADLAGSYDGIITLTAIANA